MSWAESTAATPLVEIVIGDANRVLAEALRTSLEGAGGLHVAAIASSIPELVDAVRSGHPQVVLIGERLLDCDAVVASRQVRGIAEIPIVLLGGSLDDRAIVRAFASGCAGVVAEGGTVDDVRRTILAAAAGETLVPTALLTRLLLHVGSAPQEEGVTLTARERDVLELLAHGLGTEQIAERLFLSRNTVRNHVRGITTKLGVHSKLEAVTFALRSGLIVIDDPV